MGNLLINQAVGDTIELHGLVLMVFNKRAQPPKGQDIHIAVIVNIIYPRIIHIRGQYIHLHPTLQGGQKRINLKLKGQGIDRCVFVNNDAGVVPGIGKNILPPIVVVIPEDHPIIKLREQCGITRCENIVDQPLLPAIDVGHDAVAHTVEDEQVLNSVKVHIHLAKLA